MVLSAVLWGIDRWAYAHGHSRTGLATGVFLVGYAIVRFSLEFTRQPDAQLGFVVGALSMGQLLSMIMFVAGATLLAWVYLGRVSPDV